MMVTSVDCPARRTASVIFFKIDASAMMIFGLTIFMAYASSSAVLEWLMVLRYQVNLCYPTSGIAQT